MSKCDHPECPSHLGKFQDCLSEAVWQDSLDGWGTTTGTVEWDGHYTLLSYGKAVDAKVPTDDPAAITVTIPRGHYIVEDTPSGAVYVQRYSTKRLAERDFNRIDRAYSKWAEEEGDY